MLDTTKIQTFTTKLGDTKRGGERSRLWLEGSRLTAAGFSRGQRLRKAWGTKTLTITPCTELQWQGLPDDQRASVAGTDTRPIIDINGRYVAATFNTPRVAVDYAHRCITVTESRS